MSSHDLSSFYNLDVIMSKDLLCLIWAHTLLLTNFSGILASSILTENPYASHWDVLMVRANGAQVLKQNTTARYPSYPNCLQPSEIPSLHIAEYNTSSYLKEIPSDNASAPDVGLYNSSWTFTSTLIPLSSVITNHHSSSSMLWYQCVFQSENQLFNHKWGQRQL